METKTGDASLLIPIDRSKPFNLSEWSFDQLGMRIGEIDQKAAALGQIEVRKLAFDRPRWKPLGRSGNIRIDGLGFATLWRHKISVLDRVFPQWNMQRPYEWYQCYCDGMVMENMFGIEFVPYLRAVQIKKGDGTVARSLHWGYSCTNYDWQQEFPALVVETH